MRYTVSVMLVLVAIIHLLPLSGVLSSERLTVLYGIPFNEPNLEIVMRHRAVLLGLLGAFLLYSAFKPVVQLLAFVAAFFSVISFIYLAWSVGTYNEHIGRVFIADIVALVCLVIGSVAYVLAGRHS